MQQISKEKIESRIKKQFGDVLAALKKEGAGSLTSPAKAREFAHTITPIISELLNPDKWMPDLKFSKSWGAARKGDEVIGYDWHLILITPPPLPIPITLGPFPIPFFGKIEEDRLDFGQFINRAKDMMDFNKLLNDKINPLKKSGAVYINKKLAATDGSTSISLIKHSGRVIKLLPVKILGGKSKPGCHLKTKSGRNVFVNGKRLLRKTDEGSGSCTQKQGKIFIIDASGSVHVG